MAYIYQITNDINGKVYVGKTEFSIEKRFKEHCKDKDKRDEENRPLYKAMNKYGIEHFHIELLEETDNPEERECFWIEQKNSYKNGYNATMGGDGKKYIDYDLVVATYQEIPIMQQVATKLGICEDSVSHILHERGVKLLTPREIASLVSSKIVEQYDKDGNYIQSFPSIRAAADALGKITATSNGAISHISDVCKGKRKTAYGYIWKFANK